MIGSVIKSSQDRLTAARGKALVKHVVLPWPGKHGFLGEEGTEEDHSSGRSTG